MRAGYKQTEVGVIPEDWEIALSEKVVSIIDGDRGYNYPNKSDLGTNGYCLFLNAGNVTKNGFVFSRCDFVTKEKDEVLRNGKLKRFDIVLTTRGTIGNFSYFDNKVPFNEMRINSGMVILRGYNVNINTNYLYKVLSSHVLGRQIDRISFGSAQPQLTVKGISSLYIPLPPSKAEQEAIAEALSDADALIASLDELIAKKRHIKQGAMQELLTGKRRLPGFEKKKGYKQTEIGPIPEDWACVKLNSIANVLSGKRLPLGKSLSEKETAHPYIRVADMRQGTVDLSEVKYVPDDVWPSIRRYTISVQDIFISVAGSLGIVGMVPDSLDGANLTENANKITEIKCCRVFLYHFMSSTLVQDVIESLRTVGAQPKLALTRIRDFNIPLPASRLEQEAIAETLSTVGDSIQFLEQRLKKAQQIKQAMMQELLTGKTRLM